MMNKIHIHFLFFFLFVGNSIFAQIPKQGEAIYMVALNLNKAKIQNFEKKIEEKGTDKTTTQEAINVLQSQKHALSSVQFKDGLSYYSALGSADMKSGINIAQIAIEKYGDFYTDISKGIVFNKKEFKGKEFLIQRNIQDIHWQITDEKKTIGKYLCTKAISTYSEVTNKGKIKEKPIIAWFMENSDIAIAPEGYYGLPGMVVQLEANGLFYSLKDIVEKEVNIDFNINENKAISYQEYIQKQIDFYKKQ
ncbi:GLPGLI family protein [Bergeyella zoohelcum]|uniref:GLPGLI family protein n=1 Tax=Bergeyella zoohelcum TaxID=1015 RepID=UPI003736292B